MLRNLKDFPARLLMSGLLATALVACQVPTSGSGLSLAPVVTLGQDAGGVARLSIRVPEGTGDRHVQSLPASWNEAVVYFDSPTARVQPYAFTIPRASFTQVAGGNISSLSATLSDAQAVELDASGNAYIVESASNRVSKFNVSTGVTTVVAGTGAAGSSGDGGPATSAQLDWPEAVGLDAAGNLYIADCNNNRVRKVNASTGIITTVAGTGSAGSSGDGGPATSAQLSGLEGLYVDGPGNLYIADSVNHMVRKVNAATGVITTVAGTGVSGYSGDGGLATAAQLTYPSAVTVDRDGNLYICDYADNRVRKVNPVSGVITTCAGTGASGNTGDGGAATSAQLNHPNGVVADSFGHLYIADCGNNRVRKVDALTGVITAYAGTGTGGLSGDGGAAVSAKLAGPEGLAMDDLGNLFIADNGNDRIRKVTGAYAEFVAGTSSSPAMPVLRPATDYAISVDLRTSGSPATLEAAGFLGGQTLRAGPNTFSVDILDNLNVTSFTGDPTITNGTGAAAFFENPMGVAVDGAGTYAYVADKDNHCIRRLEIATGIVTTVAGSGRAGSTNGAATSARFSSPTALTLAGTNLYVIDRDGSAVRKIDLALASTNAGFVTTLAGGSDWGYADGTGAAALFAGPEGIVADSGGTALYVADTGNYRIRKIDLTLAPTNAGFVSTVAGNGTAGATNGTGTAATFDVPRGVALDGAGNLYVTDFYNGLLRKIVLATQAVTTLANVGNYPHGITFDGTDMWVSEHRGSGRIRKVTLGGAVTVAAGGTLGYADGTGASARFSFPSGMAVMPGGDLLIADRDNHAIRRMVRATGVVTTLAGSSAAGWVDGPLATARFRSIRGVCLNRNNTALYMADAGNQRIRKIDLVTKMVSTVAGNGFAGWVDGTGAAAQFSAPYDVVVNDAGTTLYVCDKDNYRIRQIDLASGAVTTLAGNSSDNNLDGTGAAAGLTLPTGIDIDAAGILYVADKYGQTIRKITPAGVVSTLAGSAYSSGSTNGVGSAARFNGPVDVALDRMGNLFVVESSAHRVRRIQLSTNTVSTLAGASGSGFTDGPGASATFNEPWGIATDGGGNVYVSDIYTRAVRKVARDGYVTTVAGGSLGYQDGFRTTAKFNGLTGLAVDRLGGIYVADTDNHMVRRIK